MANIVLIENQQSQFDKIVSCFGNTEHKIFPTSDEYVEFIDKIRIALSKRYGQIFPDSSSRRSCVLKQIVDYINDKQTDIIIIDHKLVGYHAGQNGIELANYFRKEYNLLQPIIFLSRTERNDQRIRDKIEEVKDCIWVEKGYASQQILDETYFQKYIITEITKLIKSSEFSFYLAKLESIISARIWDDSRHLISNKILNIKTLNAFSVSQILAINNYLASDTPNSEMIKQLINSL